MGISLCLKLEQVLVGCDKMGSQVNKKSSLHSCLCIYLKRIFIYLSS